jgi:hypothetical protein
MNKSHSLLRVLVKIFFVRLGVKHDTRAKKKQLHKLINITLKSEDIITLFFLSLLFLLEFVIFHSKLRKIFCRLLSFVCLKRSCPIRTLFVIQIKNKHNEMKSSVFACRFCWHIIRGSICFSLNNFLFSANCGQFVFPAHDSSLWLIISTLLTKDTSHNQNKYIIKFCFLDFRNYINS